MPEERERDYLNDLDAAADWTPEGDGFPPSFDEWNALRAHAGREPGDFTEYLSTLRGADAIYALYIQHLDVLRDDMDKSLAKCDELIADTRRYRDVQ